MDMACVLCRVETELLSTTEMNATVEGITVHYLAT